MLHPDRKLGEIRQELVQRRIDQPDGHRLPIHSQQQRLEVSSLQRFELRQSLLLLLRRFGQDEVFDECSTLTQEHVLRAAQADALGAEASRSAGVVAGVCVGPDLQASPAVGHLHQPVNGTDELVPLDVSRFQNAFEITDHG